MRPEVRDALRRFADGDPSVRVMLPDVPTTDDTGQPAGVGIDVTADDLDLPALLYLDNHDEGDDQ